MRHDIRAFLGAFAWDGLFPLYPWRSGETRESGGYSIDAPCRRGLLYQQALVEALALVEVLWGPLLVEARCIRSHRELLPYSLNLRFDDWESLPWTPAANSRFACTPSPVR